ncbi:MAG: hypothetical protein R3335_11070 [Anaerolineales bacterium]|nr:hypothetical protein [Anaerolineales bacterium]
MKKWIILTLSALVLAGCTTAAVPEAGGEEEQPLPEPEVRVESGTEAAPEPVLEPTPRLQLDDFGEAPELNNEVWLNTDGPLRLADLRGSVVLLDMWTFG